MQIDLIVFPTDFTEGSRQAFAHAVYLAAEFDATLHVMHAAILHRADSEDSEDRHETGSELLEEFVSTSGSELGDGRLDKVRIRQERRHAFSPSIAVLDYAEEIEADLIVMGTHGQRGPLRWFIGSTAAEVVRQAECPVLTVREREQGPTFEGFKSILAPVDFSTATTNAVRHAAALAEHFTASVELLHVVDAPLLPVFYGPVPDAGTAERLEELAKRELADLAAEHLGSVDSSWGVRQGRAWREITAEAHRLPADLLVLPTHGHGALDRLLLGSTTERVLRSTDTPVLSLRPGVSIL